MSNAQTHDDNRILAALRAIETAAKALREAKDLPHCVYKKRLIANARSDIESALQVMEPLRDIRS